MSIKLVTTIGLMVVLLISLVIMSGMLFAHETNPEAHHDDVKAADASDLQLIALPDVELITQDNSPVLLDSDVVGDRIVVMDFVYTTCTTVCPVLSAILSQVQTRLEERLGKEVVMTSLSVDPIRDTPQRLKSFAAKHGAQSGWTWLTGEKPIMDKALQALGVYTANFEDHPSMVLVGDGRTGQWARFVGFPTPDQIMVKVEQLLLARESAASSTAFKN